MATTSFLLWDHDEYPMYCRIVSMKTHSLNLSFADTKLPENLGNGLYELS